MTTSRGFAGSTLPRHLLRGAVGFGSLAAAVLLLPAVGPLSLLLLPLGLFALRGCPMCWTLGLIETLSRGRLDRTCTDGSCRLVGKEGRRGRVLSGWLIRLIGPRAVARGPARE
ncbi:hypothetical protein AB0K51_24095 [Kitasatospora sp. NPDC049285]|uniref:hypothetical protein n=1 Tax=Kitasatospora sp. NPDC049285 TaxID=3157096 RepID=UPI00342E9C77